MDNYELVDLFAGAGGLGVAARGLGVLGVGIEWDKSACATRRAAGLATQEGDVRDLSPSDFPSANILAGGPPCQTYNFAGTGAGRHALTEAQDLIQRMARREDVTARLAQLEDLRGHLVLEPLRWALDAIDSDRPYEAVVLAQVPTVLPVWQATGDVLSAEGYSVAYGMLRAEEYGVPQTRRYAVLIARRQGTALLPKATHQPFSKKGSTAPGDPSLRPCVTMGEVLDRPEPFTVVSNYGIGGDPKARGRRTSAQPAATVSGKIFRCRVVTEDDAALDRLSASEAGQLQSFPKNYPWTGQDKGQQIGNATPPLLASHILAAALDLAVQSTRPMETMSSPSW
ncbi:DNA cytosine methyltransferase [Streptomyces sp. NBC_00243]|uniref:DNA cytosine methyltransferase n=1 Tax=Streptomyces sp. NBC_00243 TaxID=2975688 RepID=UPI002DDA2938|nr:DNA cytosine methyltransferase [Streptomyces sp. NBC_00243]WRZ21347.1 DNA cytosine methyltransferase [Streptomyces sp. NBC_00243]